MSQVQSNANDSTVGNNYEDFPHDEARSVVSHGTYLRKDSTFHGISTAAPKRSARKAPPTEQPDRKISVASSRPLSCRASHSTRDDNDEKQQLLLGLPQSFGVSDGATSSDRVFRSSHRQLQPPISRPPPGFTSTLSEDNLFIGNSTFSSTFQQSFSGSRFDDATEERYYSSRDLPPEPPEADGRNFHREPELNLDNILRTFSINPTTVISSLTPGESHQSNSSDRGSICGGNSTAITIIFRYGNPRSILNERYQKAYNRSFTKKDFVTLRDSQDGDHVPRFTSLFMCPEFGECFRSGSLLSEELLGDDSKHERNGMIWYKKKKNAEFAAAGRAEDCLRRRECDTSDIIEQFCAEAAYPIRSKEDEKEEIEAFLRDKACDSVARDRVEAMRLKRGMP